MSYLLHSKRREAFCNGCACFSCFVDVTAFAGIAPGGDVPPGKLVYLLYSSTISCSFTGRLTSSRFGNASTLPERFL